jgi:cyanophycinase
MTGTGCVIAVGGNEDKRGTTDSILGTFAERAGGSDARIVIIPSASIEPERRAAQYADVFRALGAACIRIVHAERSVSKDDLLLIENAGGIFVTGGDQQKLMMHLRRTGCADAIVDAVRSGAVYAGTSAGAAAVSHHMIASSRRRGSEELVKFGEGLGLVPGVIVDQHFSERRRLTRLMAATKTWNMPGVGIDEDTAAVWSPDGSVEVIGRGGITIVHPEVAAPMPRAFRLHVLDRESPAHVF